MITVPIFDWKTLEQEFDEVERREGGSALAKKELPFKGDAGDLPFYATVEFFPPPEGYEDRYMFKELKPEGRGAVKYRNEMIEVAKKWLIDLWKDLREKEGSKGSERWMPGYIGQLALARGGHVPLLFSPNEIPEIVAEEWYYERGKKVRRLYFRRNGHYYMANGDVLRVALSDRKRDGSSRAIKLLNGSGGVILKTYERMKIPAFYYEGEIPAYYYSNGLYFQDKASYGPCICDEGVFGSTQMPVYKTANELYMCMENEEPEVRKRVVVHDRTLLGPEYHRFQEGESAFVDDPFTKGVARSREALKGQTGLVVKVDRTTVTLQFMNYFEEVFHVSELKKTP